MNSIRYVCSFAENQLLPRFSPKWDPDCSISWKIARVAGHTLILGAGAISYLAHPQYTFIGFVLGVACKDGVRHIISTNWNMATTVSLVCVVVLLFFSIPSAICIYLFLPPFIGSFMAFHALSNPDGKLSYFSLSTAVDKTSTIDLPLSDSDESDEEWGYHY